MMKSGKRTRYSLHITISTLFVSLMIVFGLIISWQNYKKTSAIIISSGNQVFDQLNRELLRDLQATRNAVTQTIDLLALSPLIYADSLPERLQELPLLSTALRNEAQMSAIEIGYPNGDYFIVRPVNSDTVKDQFNAPEQAAFIVDQIDSDSSGTGRLLRLFFNRELQEISRISPDEIHYDPRSRPWYQLAMQNTRPVITRPYLFYFFRKVGATFSVAAPQTGVVVAADITLDQLSRNIARYSVTPSTEIVLFGADGSALAYQDPKRLIMTAANNRFMIAKLSQLGSAVLTHLGKDLQLKDQTLNFVFNQQRWLGAVRKLDIAVGVELYVLMVSPEKELLEEANAIRWQSLLITALIILVTVPVIWLFARKISKPLRLLAGEANLISHFDFGALISTGSIIKEVDELSEAMRLMKSTIGKFMALIDSLAGERNLDSLLQRINLETMQISDADAALTCLFDEQKNELQPRAMHDRLGGLLDPREIAPLCLNEENPLTLAIAQKHSSLIRLDHKLPKQFRQLLESLHGERGDMIALPLRNREEQLIGVLYLLYHHGEQALLNDERISFVQALSGFAAVSLESRQLIMMQKALLDAFIKLLAGAIDSKSPYTGGHCQRVPELTRLLAQAACDSNAPPFVDFQLDEHAWEALNIASWLHDCGKVTTPEYVVDKATKLETIYDRIHEIRMRFEVLKRDAEIRCWQKIAAGGNRVLLQAALNEECRQLDQDFAFVAACNEGGESMSPENLQRLQRIAETTWTRTLDDRIGISWEEKQRKEKSPKEPLPCAEKLLADKVEHLIERGPQDQLPEHNHWGFRMHTPQYKYNRGELYNLSVQRGTLTAEERYKINDHIVQTIIMLERLPYPKHLQDVPKIAGSHHEKMDGTGYPRGLTGEQMPLTGRIMAIADIFEALTASDRPYKKPKKLSEALAIMAKMSQQQHIDGDLFKLFIVSGACLEYARKHLQAGQIDSIDINRLFPK